MRVLTEKVARDIESMFQCQKRGLEILELVVSEWESDPMSVPCFDLRIVQEAKELVARYKRLRSELYLKGEGNET